MRLSTGSGAPATEHPLCGDLRPLRDFGDGSAAAVGGGVDAVPRLAGGDHAGDAGVALVIFGATRNP